MRLIPLLLVFAGCDGAKPDDTAGGDTDTDTDSDTDTDTDTEIDADGDGYTADEDCNDDNAAVHPGAAEVCDPGDVDEDCNGVADSADSGLTDGVVAYHDADGDGYGDPGSEVSVCEAGGGYVTDGTDCDDTDGDVHPGAVEVCDPDDVDEDCSGAADDADSGVTGTSTFYADADGDGLGDAGTPVTACDEAAGRGSDDSDCDDTDAAIGAPTPWYADADEDGYGDPDARVDACAVPTDYLADATDCDDADAGVNPGAAETCSAGDEDCDGLEGDADASLDLATATAWYADADGDGYGDPAGSSVSCEAPGGAIADDGDCDDADAGISPAATEVCDGADNDCDGATDADDAADASTWYADADGDGYGDPTDAMSACEEPGGYTDDATDCDDEDADAYPGAAELCDGVDEDCDGNADLLVSWAFDEGSGTTATDGSGNGLDGAITGAAWTTGHSGYALETDGSDYVAITDPIVERTGDFSVSIWVHPDSLRSGSFDMVATIGSQTGNGASWEVSYYQDDMRFASGTPTYASGLMGSDASAQVGGWHHLVITYDATTLERTLYLDGAYDASDVSTTPISYDGSPLVVGADTNYGSQSFYDVNFRGALDEFRYYDCVLADTEVADIYAE